MAIRLSDNEILQRCSELLEDVGSDLEESRWRKKLEQIAKGLDRLNLDKLTSDQRADCFTILAQFAYYNERFDDAISYGQSALSYDTASQARKWIDRAQLQKKQASAKAKGYGMHWMHEQIRLLRSHLKHPINAYDAEFLPSPSFYSTWTGTNEDLGRMARQLYEWLQIPIRENTTVSFRANLSAPGLFFLDDDGDEVILIDTKHANDRFASAAILAHEMMHLYLGRAGVRYAVRNDNERLTDVATIEAGFGILIVNGMSHSSEWLVTLLMLAFGRLYWRSKSLTFGYFNGRQYSSFLKQHLKDRGRDAKQALSYVVPAARHFVGGNPFAASSPDPTIAHMRKRKAIMNVVASIIAVPIVLFIFAVYSQSGANQSDSSGSTTTADQTTINNLQSQAQNLKRQLDACQSDLEAKRPYVNQYDQSAVDSFNAEVDSCNNTEDQYNAAANAYDQAIGQPSN